MDPLLMSAITEQIAGLRATATVFIRQRADALAAAEAAATQEAGATARADALQAALDALRAIITPTEPDQENENV